jgi:hypothetical protein
LLPGPLRPCVAGAKGHPPPQRPENPELPRYGKSFPQHGKSFPRYGKIRLFFSTPWKKFSTLWKFQIFPHLKIEH